MESWSCTMHSLFEYAEIYQSNATGKDEDIVHLQIHLYGSTRSFQLLLLIELGLSIFLDRTIARAQSLLTTCLGHIFLSETLTLYLQKDPVLDSFTWSMDIRLSFLWWLCSMWLEICHLLHGDSSQRSCNTD